MAGIVQIHIFNSLAGILQLVVLVPVMRFVTNSMLRGGTVKPVGIIEGSSPLDIYDFLYKPLAIVIIAILLVLTLLCIIFFYRKKIEFRLFFIAESVIYIAAMGAFYYFFMNDIYSQTMDGFAAFNGIFIGFALAFGLLPMLGIAIAFIIALFKSYRVKNTFS